MHPYVTHIWYWKTKQKIANLVLVDGSKQPAQVEWAGKATDDICNDKYNDNILLN